MSRNSSGTYSLPTGNPVVAGTTVEASWANSTLTDVATALTNSLDRTGKGGMLAALRTVDGNSSAPGFSFNNETGSGFYRNDAGDIRFALTGTDMLAFSSGQIDATGDFDITGDVDITGGLTVSGTITASGLFDGDYDNLSNVPSEFTPESHTHELSEITDFDAADYATSNAITAASVTFSTTLALDLSTESIKTVTLTDDTTLSFTNLATSVGRSGMIVFTQDNTGGHSITLPSEAKTPNGGATITQVTTADTVSALTYVVVSATQVLVNYIGDFQ